MRGLTGQQGQRGHGLPPTLTGHHPPTRTSWRAGGVAEDLAAALQRGCGSYFKEDDKLYYQACGLLQRAEAAAAMGELAGGETGGGGP